MNSIIYNETARFLRPILLVLALWVLYRGHHLPGGGFIGGLLAAVALLLPTLYGAARWSARGALHFIAAGLLVALGSGLPGLLSGQSYMTGQWLPAWELGGLSLHLGTPLLFDLGVFLTVIGFAQLAVQAVTRLSTWK